MDKSKGFGSFSFQVMEKRVPFSPKTKKKSSPIDTSISIRLPQRRALGHY